MTQTEIIKIYYRIAAFLLLGMPFVQLWNERAYRLAQIAVSVYFAFTILAVVVAFPRQVRAMPSHEIKAFLSRMAVLGLLSALLHAVIGSFIHT